MRNGGKEFMFDCFNQYAFPSWSLGTRKIDALLSRNEDLKVIKKQNHKIAKQLTVQKELEKFKEIVKVLNKS